MRSEFRILHIHLFTPDSLPTNLNADTASWPEECQHLHARSERRRNGHT